MSGIYRYRVLLDPLCKELAIRPDEPIKKDIIIEWGLEQAALVRVEDNKGALRIIIEEAQEA